MSFTDFSVRWRGYCLFYILDAGSPAFINSSFLSKVRIIIMIIIIVWLRGMKTTLLSLDGVCVWI